MDEQPGAMVVRWALGRAEQMRTLRREIESALDASGTMPRFFTHEEIGMIVDALFTEAHILDAYAQAHCGGATGFGKETAT